MRADVTLILVGMGYQALVDFTATLVAPGDVAVTWLAATPMPTEAEIDAFALANPTGYQDRLTLDARTAAVTAVDADRGPSLKLLRAVASVLVDELNALRQWHMAFKGEVAAASNLADLKTRVAGLPNLPDRTLEQAKTAIQNAVQSGAVD